ncbi:MAG: hypothetical protein HC850_10185 [Rhodomicrobium sp.]|nr:hypothetical protein [Rhodomicrobium sp.]
MTVEAWSIFIYGLLVFLGVTLQATYQTMTAGPEYGVTNRDKPQPGKGRMGYRIDNTLNNLKEGALMYVPLTLLTIHFGISNPWTYYAAWVTIVSRLLYIPIYVLGIQTVRTLVWAPSFLAVPALAYGIFLGLPQA